MHHVTLHKSSKDVDVTYKADVKFNVMGPRVKSGCIAALKDDAFRPAITSRTRYVSAAWCINFNRFVLKRNVQEMLEQDEPATKVREQCLPMRTSDRKLDARYSSSGMRNRPVSTSAGRCAEEKAIYVRSQSTASPEKSARIFVNLCVIDITRPFYTSASRILRGENAHAIN